MARELPSFFYTECGVVNCVNAGDMGDVVESRHLGTRTGPHDVYRSWKGFESSNLPARNMTFHRRVTDILEGRQRSPGLDAISRSGMVRVEFLD